MKIISHIIPNIVHGGMDDGAGLSLWIDERADVAHLCGHSGSFIPLDGPVAPDEAPSVDVDGRSGMMAIFTEAEIDDLVARLSPVLNQWVAGRDDDNDALLATAEEILQDVDLEEQSYLDWVEENDPEVFKDLA